MIARRPQKDRRLALLSAKPSNLRVTRTSVGRADLARLLSALPPQQAASAAELLGFQEHREEEVTFRVPPDAGTAVAPPIALAPREAMPFLRLEEMDFVEAPEPPPEALRLAPTSGLTKEDLESPGCVVFKTPRSTPLTPWSRLWPALRGALRASAPGRDPDVGALVRAWARGEVLAGIPRVKRAAWVQRACLWVDRSARLVPFWSDQEDVCRRLRKACGVSSLEVRYFEEEARPQIHWGRRRVALRPDPETPILVLGDLGTYGTETDQAAWLSMARRLTRARVPLSALVPSPPARWEARTAKAWGAKAWEFGRLRGGVSARQSPDFWIKRAEELLRIASPAMLVQPGLLRALRRILPAWQVDAATEADVWSHPDVRAADPTGLVLHPAASERLREELASTVGNVSVKEQVRAAIEEWHRELPRELLRAETLVWHALVPDVKPPPELLEEAKGFADRLAYTLASKGEDMEMGDALRIWSREILGAMPAAAYKALPSLNRVWAAAFQGMRTRVPEGVERWAVFSDTDDDGERERTGPRWWAVRQVGSTLVLSRSPGTAWPSHEQGPGSPVAWLLANGRKLTLTRGVEGAETRMSLEEGLSIPLRSGEGLSLRTDLSSIRLSCWRREKWAVAAGQDRFGLWAEADVKGVPLRFRWIPPGRFWMGSPEGEAGRFDDEGPRHRVTWTTGRWLAEVPVTQALWAAVMGENPSRFVSPDRPVEQVSWDDCTRFLETLNGLAPELELEARLPSEAEWEHACRAGTETATWLGDLEILGERNAPLLDPIAWYGGNCGVGFDLDNGYDTSSWEETQHSHTKGGSHPVRKKLPNPWGLHDMLGNVHEWCLDKWNFSDGYAKGDVADPSPGASGALRVHRGGSWFDDAGHVRAAYRSALTPGRRDDILGSRLARGQAPGPRSGASGEDAERPADRGAGRAAVSPPSRDAASGAPKKNR